MKILCTPLASLSILALTIILNIQFFLFDKESLQAQGYVVHQFLVVLRLDGDAIIPIARIQDNLDILGLLCGFYYTSMRSVHSKIKK